MGFKLVEKIQLMKHVPSKYKRILMAIAQRSRNDGTNFYESKETIAGKASSSRWTVYRNLEDLIRAAVVVKAESHECSKEGCTKGTRHLVGNGHWTQAYDIDLATLQNATWLDVAQRSKTAKPPCSKTPNSHVAKCDAILGCDAATLGNVDPSVLTDGLSVSQAVNAPASPSLSNGDRENPSRSVEQEKPVEQERGFRNVLDELGCDSGIPALLGLPYFTDEHDHDMRRIVHVLLERNRSLGWLEDLVKWVKTEKGREPDFWRKRLHIGDRAVRQLANYLERGELPMQFDAVIVAKGGKEILNGFVSSKDRKCPSVYLLHHYDADRQTLVGVAPNGKMVGYEDDQTYMIAATAHAFDVEEA
jgi:hypothetical protein